MNETTSAEVFPPGEFLKDELEARNWTQVELAEILGRPPRVISEIILGKRSVTPETAKGFAAAFGTSAQFWMNLETLFQLSRAHLETDTVARRARLYSKFPVKEMLRRGWVEFSDDLDVLEKRFLDFFGLESIDDDPCVSHVAKKTHYDSTSVLQLAWLNRAKQIARTIEVKKYSAAALKGAIDELKKCLADTTLIRNVPVILTNVGVRLVVVEHLPGAKIDGACFWLDAKAPVVVLSLRLDRVDNFWHTLFHEIDHILNEEGKDQAIIDCIEVWQRSPNQKSPPQEQRANQRAAEYCVPQDEFKRWLLAAHTVSSRAQILSFSRQIGVHPGLVVGQLQHGGHIPYSYHRNLLEKVRVVVVTSTATDGFGMKSPI